MRWGPIVIALLGCACGSSTSEPLSCPEGESRVDGQCVADSLPCPEPGIPLLDGSCVGVGIPPDGCAEGFAWSDGACEPILPDQACGPGTLALPGETACHPVMECPTDPWGGIDGGATPQWVDGGYSDGDSDGTQARPWPTIGQAVLAAAPGSVIGIAAGSYPENVEIVNELLHLRGTCPDQVEILGQPTPTGVPAVVLRGAGTTGSSVAGIAITGPAVALGLSGGTEVIFERLWVHDAADIGVDIEDPLGPTSATLRDSLVENSVGRGVLALGAAVAIDRSVVRGTSVGVNGLAHAVHATVSDYGATAPGVLTLSSSVVENNAGMGIFVVGSDALVDGSLVRNHTPINASSGYGLGAQVDVETARRPNVEVTRSAFVANTLAGINLFGAQARIASTLVRGTLPGVDPSTGAAVGGGRGVNIQDDITDARASVELVASTVEGNQGLGLFATGSDITLEATLIRDSLPGESETERGRGASLQPSALNEAPTVAVIHRSLVLRSQELGILVGGSQLTLDESVVRSVVPAPGNFGFGDAVAALPSSAEVSVLRSSLEDSGRAGLSLFGASGILTDSRLFCHPIDIAVEDLGGTATLSDGGGNRCGCDGEIGSCKASTANLEPPSPL